MCQTCLQELVYRRKPKGVRLMNFRGAKTGSVMQVKLARKIGQSCIGQSG